MLPYVDCRNHVTLYYENLIDDNLISDELDKLSKFLGQKKVARNDFLSHITEHREIMLEMYAKGHALKSLSGGTKKVFHSKGGRWNDVMRDILKEKPLTEKYLKKYL